ncbi:lateral signaling target protein 2 homolog isoform X2 [Dermochelys coriacea]|uniref:lateral signaling target protein 2 homolog isoform X2 n=1 Tax=Dermochelys coriacea TaxID=27794 RepID=UPI0018E6ECF3|nr:lateral signaling target protein 2 homolog isoform X2 [Dermochelys coriacea]
MLPAAVRKWLHRPKRSDPRLLSQFFYADERVTRVVMEINGLDVETDPQQYLVLLNQLHLSQAHLLTLIEQLMNECIPKERHCRDYLAKFPEELLVDNLGNHVLFAAECLVAGTVLELEEADGLQLRPLAKNLVCSLQLVRKVLREQSLSQASPCSEPVRMALIRFDTLFAEFELSYVSLLVSVKSPEELYKQQEIVVLFCETVARALKLGYLSQDMIDGCEPLLMFTIPRLAIISGLLIYPEGPLSLERTPEEMSRVFSPFHSVLKKIRDLLRVLSEEELALLEKSLCAAESEGPCSAAGPEPRGEAALDTSRPVPWSSPQPAPNCSLHPPAAVGAQRTAACSHGTAGAPGTASGAPRKSKEEAKEPVPPGSDPLPERPLNVRTSDVDAACTGSASSGLWTPAKAVRQGVPGTVGNASRDMRLQMYSAMPEGAGHTDSMGPPWHRGQQSWACSTDHGQLALVASRPQEPTLPGGCMEARACLQNGWVRPLPPLLPGDSSGSLGQQPGSAQGRVLPRAVLPGARSELRSCYSSTQDMIHTLFVCISGVADQLQTNFASDLRSILKTVFHIVTSQPEAPVGTDTGQEEEVREASPLADCALCSSHREGNRIRNGDGTSRLPPWVPDGTCSQCTSCRAPFSMVRRRHHCRSCGKIFCSRCSQHTAPLPHYGLLKPVRVCIHCYTMHLPARPPTPSHR